MLSLIKKKIDNALALFQVTKGERKYLKINKLYFIKSCSLPGPPKKSKQKVLVQFSRDSFYWIRIIPLLYTLRLSGYKILFVNHFFDYRPVTLKKIIRELLESRRWKILYPFRVTKNTVLKFQRPIEKVNLVKAKSLLAERVKSKRDLLDIAFNGINVGDLLYDTYLRYKPAPTLDIQDPLLEIIVSKALSIFDECERFFLANRDIEALFTTYCSYIEHGILVRYALSKNVRVFALGAPDPFLQEVSEDFPSHLKNYTKYKRLFAAMSESAQKIACDLAAEALEKRLKGTLDGAISYMKSSAYRSELSDLDRYWLNIFQQETKKKVLIPLHCFFDSPHIYRTMLFPDFLTWVEAILDRAEDYSNIEFYVKPHPNGLPENETILDRLKSKYSKVQFLPSSLSNITFLRGQINAVLTVYGTIGHEFPFAGIPVINAGDNPHADFDFCITPKTIEELLDCLRMIDENKFFPAISKKEICAFYFMHNLWSHPGRLMPEFLHRYPNKPGRFNFSELTDFTSLPEPELLSWITEVERVTTAIALKQNP